MKKPKKRGITLEDLISICIAIVFLAIAATWLLALKEKYAGKAAAYSREQMSSLPSDSLEYQIVKHFYSKEALASITYNADTDHPSASGEVSDTEAEGSDGIEIQKIYGPTYEGYMMLVHNPEDLSVAINPYFAEGGAGPSLDEYVSYYNAIGGLNDGLSFISFDDLLSGFVQSKSASVYVVSGLISNKSPSTAFASFSAIFSVTFPADAEKYATSMLIFYSPYYSICLMI